MVNNKNQNKNKLKEDKIKDNKTNECPKKDKDGNCQIPGVYGDSEAIGGG